MPTQWSEAEQVPLGYIAPPRPQARNSKASLCEGGGAKRRRERYAAAAPQHQAKRDIPRPGAGCFCPRRPLFCLCFSFRCRFCSEMQGCAGMARTFSKQRPLAATYLCRFAAKGRFDNRTNPRGEVSKGEGSRPLPFGRFKGKGSLRKGGNRNPPFLKWRSLVTFFRQGKKVTRRRHPAPGRGTPLHRFRERIIPPEANKRIFSAPGRGPPVPHAK